MSRPNGGPNADGQLVYRSPCCDREVVVDEWRLEFARARTGGKMRLACGTSPTTPGWRTGDGCGQVFVVDLNDSSAPAQSTEGRSGGA